MISYPNVKLNLGLHVLRRREDGYHDLDTLFVPYTGLHDTLEIITGDDFSRTSAHLQETYTGAQLAQGITPDGKLMITLARKEGVDWDPLKDLTVRAYGLLAEQYKLPPMKIYLEKTSPVGAGLGDSRSWNSPMRSSPHSPPASAATAPSSSTTGPCSVPAAGKSWSPSTSTFPATGWT